MTYETWLMAHKGAKNKIIAKLLADGRTKKEIREYFDFENMRVMEPDFCPLYAQNVKCHDMLNLNCFFCACPFFYVKDNDSFCKKGLGTVLIDKKKRIQDCSNCILPHQIRP